MTKMKQLVGTCLCEKIIVTTTPDAAEVDACHCTMCRKWAAGPFMAMGCGNKFSVQGEEFLAVYKSSEWAERVFCSNCGTSIAWRLSEGGSIHVSSQLFSETNDYPLGTQVFIDEKPRTYSFAEKSKTMTGAEIFAMFAPKEGQ